MSLTRRSTSLLVAPLLLLLGGCGSTAIRAPAGPSPHGTVITRDQIVRTGARNAWEALQRGGTHLTLIEDGAGVPGDIIRRGRGSILLDDSPVVIVDGTRTVGLDHLRLLPAETISSIRVLSGPEAAFYHGSTRGSGAILVTTRIR